ncbi:MAG: hypothetical protein U5J78_02470 [Parasphingorhabdus sp.]|nr:hypothetical protein [Parasphingorhabdus sp.]
MSAKIIGILLVCGLAATAAQARVSLGIFQSWGAFRDDDGTRCYAIAMPTRTAAKPENSAFATFGYWPAQAVRAQFSVGLSRDRSTNSRVTLSVAGRRFTLSADRAAGWTADRKMDLAIVAAVRSAKSMTIESVGRDGKPIVDAYLLQGAPSAIDAAALGCVKR